VRTDDVGAPARLLGTLLD